MKKVDYLDLFELEKEIKHPFSRNIYIERIKKEYGDGISIKYDLGNGLAIFYRDFILNQDIILVEKSNISGACFIFNLSNSINFIYQDKKEYILKKNHFFIELASSKFSCEVPIKKNTTFKSFFIGIKEQLFLKLAYSINDVKEYMKKASKNSYSILEDLQIDTYQFELFSNFRDKNYFEDILKSIYLESETMNLLHYSISKCAKHLNTSDVDFDKNRISSLVKAKEIIMQEYNKNLSIKEIAHRTAINECYLKKDFKEYYGVTIFEMIQKRRLHIAKQLLHENYCVKEVSFKIGYKHTGNFIKLFNRYFGITPSKYKKTINIK